MDRRGALQAFGEFNVKRPIAEPLNLDHFGQSHDNLEASYHACEACHVAHPGNFASLIFCLGHVSVSLSCSFAF